MRKIKLWYSLILFLLYMIVCFTMPTLIIGNIRDLRIESGERNNDMNFEDVSTLKLLLTESNQIVEMKFEDYLKGVLIGEVPVTYEMDALKAQAVVARTYTLYKLKNASVKHENGADMCDNINCCQAYKTKEYALASWDDEEENAKWKKIEDAVNTTSGEVILYNGELINAFFHAHSGGKTENVKYLWSKSEIPYLVSVSGNEENSFPDSKSFTRDEFKNLIKDKIPDFSGDSKIIIKDYTGSGRVNNLSIAGIQIEAATLRNLIGIRSTNFRVEESDDNITFYTVGYGHGVGLSQEGANQMALNGKNYKEIIEHYYTGVTIANWMTIFNNKNI